MSDLVTIAIHTGLKKWIHLLENSIKSFLLCNTYPDIELMLVETGQNEDVRAWLERLDFDNFVNFDGTKTTIKKNPKVSISKRLLFPNFEDPNSGVFSKKSSPYIQSVELAFKAASGKYFTYMAEDHQFTIHGDVISDYIDILEELGSMNHMVSFLPPHKYKLAKKNNRYTGPHHISSRSGKRITYFLPIETKWEQYMFCRKDLYKVLGPIKDWDKSHGPNKHYTKVAEANSIKRVYAGITSCMWFYDDDREESVTKIKQGLSNNPNFVLYKIWPQEAILGSTHNGKPSPMTTDSFAIYNTEDNIQK